MSLEVKAMALKALDERGEGEALFAVWGQEDHDGDLTERGFFGDGVQEVFMVPHHLWTSGEPPLAKGVIYERAQGAVYAFKMNLDLERARSWHKHFLFDLREGRHPRQQWSYGFKVKPDGATSRREAKGRRLHAAADGSPGAMVIEVSPVTAAAQPLGRTLVAKSPGAPLTRAQQQHFASLERQLQRRMAERKAQEQQQCRDLYWRFLKREGEIAKRRVRV